MLEKWEFLRVVAGYGIYVWGAYLLALIVVISEIVVLVMSRRSILDHLGLIARRRRKSSSPDSGEEGR